MPFLRGDNYLCVFLSTREVQPRQMSVCRYSCCSSFCVSTLANSSAVLSLHHPPGRRLPINPHTFFVCFTIHLSASPIINASFRLQGARKQLTLTENAQLWLIPTICYGKKQTAVAFEGAWRHCISRQHLQNLEWKEIIPLPLHLAFNISTSVNKGIHPWPHQTRRSASSHVGSHVFSCCILGTSQ